MADLVKRPPRFLRDHRRRLQERSGLKASGGAGAYTFPSPVLSGILVTPQTALTFSAFFCGVNTISTDVSVLPYNVYRKVKGGGKEVDESLPQNNLIHITPNEEVNAQRYWQAKMGHVLGWGNGYSKIKRAGDGTPTELELLHPGLTRERRLPGGRLVYETDREDGREVILPENVLHVAGLSFNGLSGYNLTRIGQQAIGLGMATEEFGAAFFGNGATKSGYLKHPKTLTPEAQANLRKSLYQVHQGTKNAHNLAILEEGMDWIDNQVAPEHAQFLATRAFQVLEIARLLRIPPHKLGDYSQSHLANLEESNLDYVARTLVGWLCAIEYECNAKLLTERDRGQWFCAHNLMSLLRGNMAARSTYFRNLFDMAVVTPDEIREAEGLNPIGPERGGDKHLLQLNLTTLEQAGQPLPKTLVQ